MAYAYFYNPVSTPETVEENEKDEAVPQCFCENNRHARIFRERFFGKTEG